MEARPWHRHYDYNVPTTIRYPKLPAHIMLQLPAGSLPDKPALNFYGSEITFWELRLQSLRMANALGRLGVKKGERVGLHLPNCPQFVIAYFAILSLGAIVVNLNPLNTADELRSMFETTGLTTLITFDGVLPAIRTVSHEMEIPRIVVTKITDYLDGMGVSTSHDLELEEGWHHFSAILDECSDTRLPKIDIAPDDPAMIQFTGGTTGIPKGAVLTHANIIAATMACSLWGNSTSTFTSPESRSVLAVLPLSHVYGNIVVMNWAMFNCATQILVPRLDIDELMGLLANFEQITFFPAVPTLITALVNHPKATELNLAKKLGMLNSGGAPMPVELIEQIQDMGIFFNEGYGLSESTSLGISNPTLGLKKVGSIGVPVTDNDVRLVDIENGVEDVPQGEPGQIIMKSPFIMKGYWDNPEETANQLRDGWLYTGDIGQVDEDGYFFIVDRKKDMIIASGYNIYPREIDEVLYQHPKILEAVAVGIPHDYRGETVKAFVVLKEGERVTEKEILDFCREKLAAYKTPKSVEFMDELPKSAVGKVLRKVLRDEEVKNKKV